VLQEKRLEAAGDLFAVRLDGDMTRVQQMRLHIRQVAAVWGAPSGGKMTSCLPHTINVGG
jgi:hypothetical protein